MARSGVTCGLLDGVAQASVLGRLAEHPAPVALLLVGLVRAHDSLLLRQECRLALNESQLRRRTRPGRLVFDTAAAGPRCGQRSDHVRSGQLKSDLSPSRLATDAARSSEPGPML
jgi:hypothetical protein